MTFCRKKGGSYTGDLPETPPRVIAVPLTRGYVAWIEVRGVRFD